MKDLFKDKIAIKTILRYLDNAENIMLGLDNATIDILNEIDNEGYGLPHCIRWGVIAAKETVEHF